MIDVMALDIFERRRKEGYVRYAFVDLVICVKFVLFGFFDISSLMTGGNDGLHVL